MESGKNLLLPNPKKNRNKADKKSYFIDNLVRDEILKNDLLKNIPVMRLNLAKSLLSFNRLKRRSIAICYSDFYNKHKGHTSSELPTKFINIDDVGILFTFHTDHTDLETQDALNEYAIRSYYIQSKHMIKSIILISTNNRYQIKIEHRDKLEKLTTGRDKEIMKLLEDHRRYVKQTVEHKSES